MLLARLVPATGDASISAVAKVVVETCASVPDSNDALGSAPGSRNVTGSVPDTSDVIGSAPEYRAETAVSGGSTKLFSVAGSGQTKKYVPYLVWYGRCDSTCCIKLSYEWKPTPNNNTVKNILLDFPAFSLCKIGRYAGSDSGYGSASQRYGSEDPHPHPDTVLKCQGSRTLIGRIKKWTFRLIEKLPCAFRCTIAPTYLASLADGGVPLQRQSSSLGFSGRTHLPVPSAAPASCRKTLRKEEHIFQCSGSVSFCASQIRIHWSELRVRIWILPSSRKIVL